ncbi:unnamed protein product [Ceutorhynchus assimilis]|uniref:RanBD1 domain-containing protein n=1 Tax=Ceutorhynchus assimilis TaxID=467358 RepID=A0A9N9QJD4_9CUCU|nr:unnamed protein product [Ceutorhynchus assimilis]
MADVEEELASEATEASPSKKIKEDDDESKEPSSSQDNSKTEETLEENEFEICSPSNPFKKPNMNHLSSEKTVKSILKPSACSDLAPVKSSTSPTPPGGKNLKSILKPALSDSFRSPNSSLSSGILRKGILKSPTPVDPPPTKFKLRQSGFNPFSNTTNLLDSSRSDKICDNKPSNGELKFIPLESRTQVTSSQTFNMTSITSMPTFVFGQNMREKVVTDGLSLANKDTNGTSIFGLNSQDKVVKGDTETSPTSNNKNSDKTYKTSTFVFGENLHEKVILNNTSPSPLKNQIVNSSKVFFGGNLQDNGKSCETLESTSKDTNETLFSSAINTQLKTDTTKEKETKSLTESAKEYEEARANKRKYDEVEVKTGEEEEINVVSMSCKLFAFDISSKNWQERGRGTLRLNDYKLDELHHYASRVVVRASGSLRVILNTKIFADMTLEKANEKTIRMTGIDSNGEVKIFLIISSIEDSKQLYMHLVDRLERETSAQKLRKLETEASSNSDQVISIDE